MQKHCPFVLLPFLVLAAPGAGNAQDIGRVISELPPVAFFRDLGNKLTGNAPPPVVIEQPAVEVEEVTSDRGPARAEEVLSRRSQARMSKRDAFGAPETPTICTNCAD
jgi:hypothetical protein